MQPDITQLDQSVIALMHGLKMQEGGGTINYNAIGDKGTAAGAGQWSNQPNGTPTPLAKGQIPSNFANAATQYGLNPTDFSPENQNKVLYASISADKKSGLAPEQILSKWNSGDPNKYLNTATSSGVGKVGPYNVASYVKNAMGFAQSYAQKNNTSSNSSPDTSSPIPPSGITGNENPLDAAGNAILNTPGSALNFAKGVASSLNPINTANTIGQIGSQFSDLANSEGTGSAIWDIIKGLPRATLDTLVPYGVRAGISGTAGLLTNDTIGNSADLTTASKAFQEDPFGQIAPVVLALEGGAKLADTYGGGLEAAAERNAANPAMNIMPHEGIYSEAFGKGVSGIASPFVDAAGKALSVPSTLTRSVVSHLTGLNPDTISTVVSNPDAFSKLQREAASHASVADNFKGALDNLIQTNSDTGAEYQPFRQSQTPVAVPENFLPSILDRFGLKVIDGKVTADTNSITRAPADLNPIQTFYDNWGNKTSLTPNEFLNMRSDADNIAKYDFTGKTKASQTIASAIRFDANKNIRPQIDGLKELDQRMAPLIEQAKQASKDFLNKDGTFKDGAANKIANSLGVGKDNLLGRMEAISPGITKSVRVLKAVEDIQRANGIKVGTYTRGLIEGGGILTGNIPVVIASILTHPEVAVQLLRGFGYVGKAVIPILNYLHILTGDIPTKDIPAVGKKIGLPPDQIQNILEQRRIAETTASETAPTNSISSRTISESVPQKGILGKIVENIKNTPNKEGGFVKLGKDTTAIKIADGLKRDLGDLLNVKGNQYNNGEILDALTKIDPTKPATLRSAQKLLDVYTNKK